MGCAASGVANTAGPSARKQCADVLDGLHEVERNGEATWGLSSHGLTSTSSMTTIVWEDDPRDRRLRFDEDEESTMHPSVETSFQVAAWDGEACDDADQEEEEDTTITQERSTLATEGSAVGMGSYLKPTLCHATTQSSISTEAPLSASNASLPRQLSSSTVGGSQTDLTLAPAATCVPVTPGGSRSVATTSL